MKIEYFTVVSLVVSLIILGCDIICIMIFSEVSGILEKLTYFFCSAAFIFLVAEIIFEELKKIK